MKLRRNSDHGSGSPRASLGIDRTLAAPNSESPNPPRTQQEIMKERYAACRDLHGSALKDCMANYVGHTAQESGDRTRMHRTPVLRQQLLGQDDLPTDAAQRG